MKLYLHTATLIAFFMAALPAQAETTPKEAEPPPISHMDEDQGEGVYATVIEQKTFVFEQPDALSNALRRLYVGEIVHVTDRITVTTGKRWAQISLGNQAFGYVEDSHLVGTRRLEARSWQPPRVIRNERPLAFSIRGMGETFGGGLNMRYLPFSRLGFSFTAASVLDKSEMRGTALSLSMISYLSLSNFSPMLEIGFTRLSYHQGLSTLRMTALFFTAGLEWIFDWGGFANVGVTYLRNMDLEVAAEYADARDNPIETGDYGVLDPGDENAFQSLLPLVSVGYAF
ncbi:SH3-like domain-containing protein [Myxococcota bacterium]|nr:SH3-like domain-containing protein [Myxococcota bacterium]